VGHVMLHGEIKVHAEFYLGYLKGRDPLSKS
jgi:hypothetical protein